MPMLEGQQSENKYQDSFSTHSHNPMLRRNDGKEREKLIKGWLRKKKVALIESMISDLPAAGQGVKEDMLKKNLYNIYT